MDEHDKNQLLKVIVVIAWAILILTVILWKG